MQQSHYRQVTVRCPWNAQNGDGIDVGNSSNVLIINNTIDAGDDGICMKGGAGNSGTCKRSMRKYQYSE